MPQPERLGKYDIVEVLGKGAMGVVFKGFDPDIDRTVAIKTVRKELIEEEDRAGMALARFKNEARAAGRLSHPGIVAVYDYGESGSVAYIAMEFVLGASLREYFNRGTRFAERDAIAIMVQLLEALQHAHDQGVWHRDIKPANLIIMTNGKVKIADFGIARIDTSTLTQTGVVMGSPGYMAPEQYAGGKVDRRADLFAAGVVMYQLLTGARPFAGSVESIPYKICHVEPPLPSEAEPDRGWERYNAVITRALAKQPEAASRPPPSSALRSSRPTRSRSRRRCRRRPSSPSRRPGRRCCSSRATRPRAPTPTSPAGLLGSLTGDGTPPAGRTGTRTGPPGSGTRSGTQVTTQTVAEPPSHRTLWLVGAGAAAVALLGVGVGMMLRPAPEPAPRTQALVTPPAASPVADPAPAPKPESPAVAREPERKPVPPPAVEAGAPAA